MRGYKLAVGVGHAGDYNGYTVSYREYMNRDHYRKALTAYGPHTADYMVTRLVRMAGAMKGGPELAPEPHDAVGAGRRGAPGGAVTRARPGHHGRLRRLARGAAARRRPGRAGRAAADIPQFSAATFRWRGGNTQVDNPRVGCSATSMACGRTSPT